jgi:DNA excision repair protein ERCC-4
MDNEAEDPDDPDSGWHSTAREERDAAQADARQFADDEDAMRDLGGGIGDEDMSLGSSGANGHAPQTARELREEEEDDDVMEAIATQSTAMLNSEMQVEAGGDSDDELLVVADEADGSGDVNGLDRREEQESVPIARPPPVFRAFNYDQDEVLRRSVAKRLKKGHEPVLEELPKWSLLAKVLKEIEDTMERIKTSHAG